MSESEQAPSTSDQREEASAPPAEGAPTRWGVLMRNPKRLIIALVLIVVAISAAAFASATFTSTSANPGNLAATGSLLIENSEDGAILTATGLVPGDSRERNRDDLERRRLGRRLLAHDRGPGRHAADAAALRASRPADRGHHRAGVADGDVQGQAERGRHRPARPVGERRDPHVQVHADLSVTGRLPRTTRTRTRSRRSPSSGTR